ncbi:MAG TPA: hypothetical protein VFJ16_09210 [Longimicrobium sp.]|nr:hypothetical protein [Longimicrobium sp.]
MKKLKLDSLEITSFETSPAVRESLGTVHGRAAALAPTVFACPTTPDFDCTFGCSYHLSCPESCVQFTDSIECV